MNGRAEVQKFKESAYRGAGDCPVASEPVEPYFTRLLRVLSFCLGVSKIIKF